MTATGTTTPDAVRYWEAWTRQHFAAVIDRHFERAVLGEVGRRLRALGRDRADQFTLHRVLRQVEAEMRPKFSEAVDEAIREAVARAVSECAGRN